MAVFALTDSSKALWFAGDFDSLSLEEISARFVIAYHQSEGGPWSQPPGIWLMHSVSRHFDDFIQARKAGRGQEPEWHVVRHLLQVREMCKQITRLEGCPTVSFPVLARQAAKMYAGHFDESLALPSVRNLSLFQKAAELGTLIDISPG